MAEHRTTTRLRLAQERARKQRERNNVDGDVIGQAAEEAVVLRKTYAPPTREIHEASIAAFIKFVKDPDHGLSASEAGRCVWEEWSEGRTVEELTDYGKFNSLYTFRDLSADVCRHCQTTHRPTATSISHVEDWRCGWSRFER